MKFLVTGCAGFIGSHLTERLLKSGNIVVGIDSLNDYYSPKIKLKNIENIRNNTNFKFIEGDLTKPSLFEQLESSDSFDGVFHIAGSAGVRNSIQNPFVYIENNIKVPVLILEWLKTNKNIKVVIASSSSIYGEQKEGPFKENSNSEDHPISQYAASKRSMEMFGYTYHKLFGINITFLRFFTVYGPRGRIDMAPMRFLVQILNNIPISLYGDGKVVRDFTYINDIIDGLYYSFETTKGYDIINIGCGSPHTILDLIHTIEDITGKTAIINFKDKMQGDVSLTFADISKAKEKFSFNPKTDLKTGLKGLYDWYLTIDTEMQKIFISEL